MSRLPRVTQSTVFLWSLLALFGGVTVLLFLSYIRYALLAGLLGYVLYPVSSRLSRYLGRTLGATLTVALATVAVIAPVVVLLAVAVRQARAILRTVTESMLIDAGDALLARLGVAADTVDVVDAAMEAMRTSSRGLLGNVYTLLGDAADVVIGLVVFVFLLYYLLRDGDRLVAWLRDVSPLERAEMDDLFRRCDRLLWASLVGTVVVAAVQAVLTGVAFAVLGLANTVFWTLVTFLLSLFPVIGASVVWIPASIYLFFVGRTVDAVVLFVAGTFVISGSDNVIRPFVVQHSARLNTGLTVVGLFGGLAVFGFLGLFVGPVVVGMAKHLVELLAERHGVSERTEP